MCRKFFHISYSGLVKYILDIKNFWGPSLPSGDPFKYSLIKRISTVHQKLLHWVNNCLLGRDSCGKLDEKEKPSEGPWIPNLGSSLPKMLVWFVGAHPVSLPRPPNPEKTTPFWGSWRAIRLGDRLWTLTCKFSENCDPLDLGPIS